MELSADHGGFEMKRQLTRFLEAEGHQPIDSGNRVYDANDDYPDFAIARAGLCHDDHSARQGVEDDNMNILCLGGCPTCLAVAWDCTKSFLGASFSGSERHRRRLAQGADLEARTLSSR